MHVLVTVNGVQATAFIDSGASLSAISSRFADRCGLGQAIDKTRCGILAGVGIKPILGKVSSVPIAFGDTLRTSFTACVLDFCSPLDVLLGLDVLRSLGAQIDLQRDELVLRPQDADPVVLPALDGARLAEMMSYWEQ